MRLLEYLNESVEDKFFSLLDDFLNWKEISGEELKNFVRLKHFAASVGDMFDIDVELIYVGDNKSVSGGYYHTKRKIIINIGSGHIETSRILITLLHELIHFFQYESEDSKKQSERDPIWSDRFINWQEDFGKYFFSKIENSAWVITIAGYLYSKNIDPDVLFKDIKTLFNYTYPNSLRDEIYKLRSKYYQGQIYRLVNLYSTLIYNYQIKVEPTLKDTKKKLFKLKKFEKQVRYSYRKLKGYFQRYNIK